MDNIVWMVYPGDLVQVKRYDGNRTIKYSGIVISEKYEDQNTMFPCVRVHICAENDWQECFPHEIEIISSA